MIAIPCYLSPRWAERGFTEALAHAYYQPEQASPESMLALQSAGLFHKGLRRPAFQPTSPPLKTYRTPLQTIRVFRSQEMDAIYLNDTIQMEGVEDHYHNEMMVGVPLSLLQRPERVLILGGGFGMGTCLALRFPEVQSVQVVEIDAQVVRLATQTRVLRRLNGKSLYDPRVQVHVGDAFDFLDQSSDTYDLIVFDCDITATRQRSELDASSLLALFRRLQSRLRTGGAMSLRVPIDDNYMDVAAEFGGEGDMQSTARLARQEWPDCRLLEFLSLFCGRELHVWNFAEKQPVQRRRLPGASPTYERVVQDLLRAPP